MRRPTAVLLGSLLLAGACREIPPQADGTNIFPLFRYANYRDSDDYELDVLWPFFHTSLVRDRSTFRFVLFQTENLPPVYSQTWLFPLFLRTKTPVRDDFTLVPLFGYKTLGSRSSYDLVPFWLDSVASVKLDEGSLTGMRVLFEEVDWEEAGTKVKVLDLLGLAHAFELDTTRVGFPEGPETAQRGFDLSFLKVLELVRMFGWSTDGAYSDVRVLEVMGSETFSLFRSQRRLAGSPRSGEGESHLFPFFYSGRDASSSYLHLWPLFGTKSEGECYKKYYFLYPVFATGGDPVTDRSEYDVLWPLFDYQRRYDEKTLKLLFVPIRWGQTDQKSDAPSPPPSGT